jgi:hypothetical protein
MSDRLKEVKRKLRALCDAVLSHAEANSEFLDELVGALGIEQRSSGSKPETPVPFDDVFDAFATLGVAEFRSVLEELEIVQLKAIVRSNRLDPTRLSDKWRTKQRFVDHIVSGVEARFARGDVFRNYDRTNEEPRNS